MHSTDGFSSSSASTASCTCCLLLWPVCDYSSESCELGYRCFALSVLLRFFFVFVLFVFFLIVVPEMFAFFLSEMHGIVCPNALLEILSSFRWVYLQAFRLPSNRTSRSIIRTLYGSLLTFATYYSQLGTLAHDTCRRSKG